MSIDTANLMQNVSDVFSTAYSKVSSDQAFLAFEPIGIPLSEDMFKLGTPPAYCAPLAVERLSEIANKVPQVRDGEVVRGMQTVEDVTGLMLTTSMPNGADAMVLLGSVKQAEAGPFSAMLGSMGGVPDQQFRPVYAWPSDWYDAANGANWTSHGIGETAPVPPQPSSVVYHPPVWRVLPVAQRPVLAAPVSAAHPLLNHGASPATTTRPMSSAAVASSVMHPATAALQPATMLRPAAAAAMVVAAPAKTVVPNAAIRPMQLTLATRMLVATTTQQVVTAASISISFDHCIVVLSRPWFPGQLVLLRDWYLSGYAQGAISGGKGMSDTGLMPVLTTGFVGVRNVKIVSKWSASDLQTIEDAASFGPFSMVGRSYDQVTGTLSSPGMQIVGWFCSALPVLPPVSDPGLATTARS